MGWLSDWLVFALLMVIFFLVIAVVDMLKRIAAHERAIVRLREEFEALESDIPPQWRRR